MRIAITGADGFLGRAVCDAAEEGGHGVVRIRGPGSPDGMALGSTEKWARAFEGAEVVLHLAARVHRRSFDSVAQAETRLVNVEGTRCVAAAALAAGVRRLIFVSSIGVLGNNSGATAFTEKSALAPLDPYAKSKLDAENLLREFERRAQLDIVIVRPPLIYGPFVKGNFLRLLRLVESGLPLPFASVRNRRSFIGVRNLADLLLICAVDRRAHGGLYLAADEETISTPELLRILSSCFGRRARIFPLPLPVLNWIAGVGGLRSDLQRMTTNLVVDSSVVRATLEWKPRWSFEMGIAEMVDWYRRREGAK